MNFVKTGQFKSEDFNVNNNNNYNIIIIMI